MEFAISQPKMVRLPRNEKQTCRLNPMPQMWPLGLTLAMTLAFEFSRWNVTLTFDHKHVLDQGFSWSNFEIAVSQNGMADWHWTKGWQVIHDHDRDHVVTKVRCEDLPDSDRGDFRCRRAVDSSSSLSGHTSCRMISWSLEDSRVGYRVFQSFWDLTDTTTAVLPRCLIHFRKVRPL